ncbi:MAG TPA: FAD-dependent monooxygenase [Crenalkalicoccus sp.]|nr:FAD-dependent monooxygenase [Crenalkalicoccus sp.]
MSRLPVLIVGGGPIGLGLAGELGWRGQDAIMFEKTDGMVGQPKMDFVGVRSMEMCRRWGIVEWVHQAGYNRAYPQDCAWVDSLTGHEFGREPFAALQDERPLPQSPCSRGERCPQNFFDPVLQRFARQFPGVELRHEAEVIGFEEHADHVMARVRDVRSGAETEVKGSYLVGCDGGASMVRKQLGIGMSGEGALTHTTNVIFRCAGLEQLHDKAPAYRYIFIGPQGTWATLVAIDGRDHWRFSLVGSADAPHASEDEVRAAIERAMGKPFEFEITSVMPWTRRQLVADSYGSGRVFICGDACHMTSPTGGFGMNTGLQEVENLAWKLAAMLQGWGGKRLLDTYGSERQPIASRNISEATSNLRRMLTPRTKSPPPEIFLPGPEHDAARKQFGDEYTALMKREWFTPGIHLGYMYEDSPIIVPDGTPQPEDTVTTYVQTSRPGSRAPHVWVGPGRSTLDLFGRGFVLLSFGVADGASLAEAAAARGVPLAVEVLDHAEARAAYERALVLVRPDGTVAWRGDASPDARTAATIIDTARGA